jgi:hypothetical protein
MIATLNGSPNLDQNTGTHAARSDATSTVRHLIADIIRRCPKSRVQIAEQMAARLGRKITVFMLNDFSAPGKCRVNFPAEWVAVFTEVTGDDRLQRHLAGPALQKYILFAEQDIASILREQSRKKTSPKAARKRKRA